MQRIARFPGNFLIKRFSSSSVPVKPTPKPIGAVYEAEVLSGEQLWIF
jgi:hypothetical protein